MTTTIISMSRDERIQHIIDSAPSELTYSMPHPDLKGRDRVWQDCWNCVNGIYQAPSRLLPTRDGVQDKWCFQCGGDGGSMVLVSSVRARERRIVNQNNRERQLIIDSAESRVDRQLQVEAAEQREQDERDERIAGAESQLLQMPAEGSKLQDVIAVAEFLHVFEVASFRGYGTELKAILKLRDEQGRVIVWKTGSARAWEIADHGEADTPVRVRIDRATVKRTSVYRDEAQCEISRPKFTILDS